MNEVWGSSGGDVFAVGDYGTIFHYDGTAWSVMESGTTRELSGVWGTSATSVYAVGELTVLHYDGSLWTTVQGIDTDWAFVDVWGAGPDDIFVPGYTWDVVTGLPSTILHYDGKTWSHEPALAQWLNGVWGDGAGTVFAVGLRGMILKRVEARR